MVVIQLNYITGLVLRKPFEVFCLFVCFFKLRVSQKCCIFPMIYTFYLLHRILYILIWPHPQSKENNLSWLGSWLSHHAPSTQSQTGNCLLTINTQWPFSFQAACLFDSSFLHLGDCSMVKWEARKWDELDGGTRVKNPPANTGDERVVGSIPGSGRSLGERNGYPLQYFCLLNSMDRRAWRAIVHGIAKSWTWLTN